MSFGLRDIDWVDPDEVSPYHGACDSCEYGLVSPDCRWAYCLEDCQWLDEGEWREQVKCLSYMEV